MDVTQLYQDLEKANHSFEYFQALNSDLEDIYNELNDLDLSAAGQKAERHLFISLDKFRNAVKAVLDTSQKRARDLEDKLYSEK